MSAMPDNPKLGLIRGGKAPSLEDCVAMYRHLTGREPTPQELEEAKKQLATGLPQEAAK